LTFKWFFSNVRVIVFFILVFKHFVVFSCDTLSESVFITQRHRDFFKCEFTESTE